MAPNVITAEESREFRKRRRILGWMTAGVTLCVGIAACLRPPPGKVPAPVALLLVLCGGAYFTITLMVLAWQCPRCNRCYSARFNLSWPWVNQCLHCGAELLQEQDSAAQKQD